MKKIFTLAIILFLFGACDLWEEYEINFINIESDEKITFEIQLKDSNEIISYKKFINDALAESTFFLNDTLSTQRITYDADGKIIFKRQYNFGSDTLAVETIDSVYKNDSIIVAKTEYKYNRQFLSRVYKYAYGVNVEYEDDVVYNFKYAGNNKVERGVSANNKACTDVLEYTELPNKIEINNFVESGHFSNQLLGQKNKNLVGLVKWESTCYKKENQTKPQTRFTYELDNNGFVIKQIEQYTPSYNTALDNNIERNIYTTYYTYIFN
jgi:hypothetical protein